MTSPQFIRKQSLNQPQNIRQAPETLTYYALMVFCPALLKAPLPVTSEGSRKTLRTARSGRIQQRYVTRPEGLASAGWELAEK